MAQAAEAAGFDAFFRSDHFLTMGGDGLPGPTDSWITLGAIARETDRIRLGTLVTSATFRPPGLLAVQVAQVDAMSRRARRARARRRLVRRRAHGLRVRVPALGGALRAPRGAVRDLDRAVGHSGRRDLQFRRAPLPRAGQPRAAQARPASPSAAHRGGRWRYPHASPRRHLRGRVQSPLLLARRHRAPNTTGCVPHVGPGAATPVRCGFRRPRSCAAVSTRPKCAAAPTASAAVPTSYAPTALAGTPDEVVAAAAGVRRHRRADDVPPGARPRRPRSHRVAVQGSAPAGLLIRTAAQCQALRAQSATRSTRSHRGGTGVEESAASLGTLGTGRVSSLRPDWARHGAAPTGGRHDHRRAGELWHQRVINCERARAPLRGRSRRSTRLRSMRPSTKLPITRPRGPRPTPRRAPISCSR